MEITVIDVTLEGLSDIMFDRFFDHSKEIRPPEQKLYLAEGNTLVMPSENIWSFLFRQKAPVGAVTKIEGKKRANYLSYGESHLRIDPSLIPVLHKGKKVNVGKGIKPPLYVHSASPVVKTSSGQIVKQEVVHRPALSLPWSLSFTITLVKNDVVDKEKLLSWFEKGGLLVALGAYRPRFGRFYVKEWNARDEE